MPARRPTDPRRTAHALPDALEPFNPRELTPVRGVPALDEALVSRAPEAVEAMLGPAAAPGGLPLWAKIAGVPATVLLLAGLLIMNQQRSDALLKEARADARQDRAEFRAAVEKLATAVEANTSAVKDLARQAERDRDRQERRGKER
jgi:hypothetical protein